MKKLSEVRDEERMIANQLGGGLDGEHSAPRGLTIAHMWEPPLRPEVVQQLLLDGGQRAFDVMERDAEGRVDVLFRSPKHKRPQHLMHAHDEQLALFFRELDVVGITHVGKRLAKNNIEGLLLCKHVRIEEVKK